MKTAAPAASVKQLEAIIARLEKWQGKWGDKVDAREINRPKHDLIEHLRKIS